MSQAPAAPELLIRIDRAAGEPLRGQLERQLRTAIRDGRLRAGAELPSTRALATDLGLSRGIVVGAYEQLLAEGYLRARRGSATRVAPGREAREPGARRSRPTAPQLLAKPPAALYDFRPAVPDTSTFPRRAWQKSLRRVLATAATSALDYPDPRGAEPLRVALSTYINRARGAASNPDHIVICSGFTQGFRLACTVLRTRGVSVVATEDPSHEEQREAVRDAGLQNVAIAVDEKGLIVERLEKSAAQAVLVTPAHQYPTGSLLAPERRAALLDWAARRPATVIEDDYDAEFRYDREPIGSLHGIAADRVIYVGSASKTLAPGLRLGWLAVPPDLAEGFALAKKREDLGSPSIEQLAFADFIERGELDRHLRRMRLVYRQRRDMLVAALREHLPQLRIYGIAAGLHLMLELPADADEVRITTRAAELSVDVKGTQGYRERAKMPPALILGYGALRDSAIAEGIRRLASVIRGN